MTIETALDAIVDRCTNHGPAPDGFPDGAYVDGLSIAQLAFNYAIDQALQNIVLASVEDKTNNSLLQCIIDFKAMKIKMEKE